MTQGYERGWSSSLDRKIKRLLARVLVSRTITLPPGKPIASLTFDDVPESAVTLGAPILERHGERGTFYIAAATCGMQDQYWRVASRAQIRALHEAGHELACHTANHVNVQSLDIRALDAECDTNQNLIREICGDDVRLTNFAYPFGDLGIAQKRHLERRFQSCRTIYESRNTGTMQLGRVLAIGLFDSRQDRKGLRALLDTARGSGGWLVFYTHDVASAPTVIGTSPTLLHDTLSMLADAGIPVMTVRDALAAFGQTAASH